MLVKHVQIKCSQKHASNNIDIYVIFFDIMLKTGNKHQSLGSIFVTFYTFRIELTYYYSSIIPIWLCVVISVQETTNHTHVP